MTDNASVSESRNRLAKNLKSLRLLHQKSLYCVAKETGFSYSYISALENPSLKKNPSLETLDRLAQYYNVDVSLLFM